MDDPRKLHGKPVYAPPGTPTVLHPPSAAVKRAGVAASRASGGPPGHAEAVYAPWKPVLASADQRLKGEINDALRALQDDSATAGSILDRAAAEAEAAAAPLEQAAYAEFDARIAAAGRLREAILQPAADLYGKLIAEANGRYVQALERAEAAYKTVVADVQRAQNDVKSIA